jgi:hypothetical protein
MTIKKAWESYVNEVLPAGAPAVQLQECRRAFYAGAKAMLRETLSLCDEDISEDESIEVLDQLVHESAAFVKDVLEGRA